MKAFLLGVGMMGWGMMGFYANSLRCDESSSRISRNGRNHDEEGYAAVFNTIALVYHFSKVKNGKIMIFQDDYYKSAL